MRLATIFCSTPGDVLGFSILKTIGMTPCVIFFLIRYMHGYVIVYLDTKFILMPMVYRKHVQVFVSGRILKFRIDVIFVT
jgi:hypothetical protein